MYSNYRREPDFPAALGLFAHLDGEELKSLLNDDNKFDEMVRDLKQIKDLEAEKEILMASNRSLAEFNLTKEPQLSEGKIRLQELSQEGAALCQSIESKVSEIKQKSGDTSLETTLALLQTAAAECEEESDGIAEKFLDGDIELESFLEQFTARRKLMHLRRVKADKMTEILTKQHSSIMHHNSVSSPSVYSHHTTSFSPLPAVTGSVPYPPYPTGGVFMPLPGNYGANIY